MRRLRLSDQPKKRNWPALIAMASTMGALIVVLVTLWLASKLEEQTGAAFPPLDSVELADVTDRDLSVTMADGHPVLLERGTTNALSAESLDRWIAARAPIERPAVRVVIHMRADMTAGDITDLVARLQRFGFRAFAFTRTT
jgi:hypothetical protein